jgi:hypothetical protein
MRSAPLDATINLLSLSLCVPQQSRLAWVIACNAAVGLAVSSAEDPERILDQAVEDMNNDLIRLRHATAKVRCVPQPLVATVRSIKL